MSEQQSPLLTEMIEWCHEDLSWKEHHGWPEDELARHRAVLASLERALVKSPRLLPCNWIGGNDGSFCTVCFAEYGLNQQQPACPRPDGAQPSITSFPEWENAALAAARREALEQVARRFETAPGGLMQIDPEAIAAEIRAMIAAPAPRAGGIAPAIPRTDAPTQTTKEQHDDERQHDDEIGSGRGGHA